MKVVRLELTVAQARAMSTALSQTMDHPDAVEATFYHGAEREAAYRAYRKLNDAVREAGGFN